MTRSSEQQPIRIKEKDGNIRKADVGQLLDHLSDLGFTSFEGGRGVRNAFERGEASWARFEIKRANDTVKIEVDREDETITRACLSRGYFDPSNFYLQVSSKIGEEDKIVEEAEVVGVFPLPIVFISASQESLDFYDENGNFIKITRQGKIRFHKAAL